jgi:hypothetical protein
VELGLDLHLGGQGLGEVDLEPGQLAVLVLEVERRIGAFQADAQGLGRLDRLRPVSATSPVLPPQPARAVADRAQAKAERSGVHDGRGIACGPRKREIIGVAFLYAPRAAARGKPRRRPVDRT